MCVCVCVLDRRFSSRNTRKPMWSAKCSSVFSERVEVFGNVSQHVASRGGKGAGTEAVFDWKRSQRGEHCCH